MRKLVFFILLIIIGFFHENPISAQGLKIGIFNENAIQSFIFTAEGNFHVQVDSLNSLELRKGNLLYISLLDSILSIRDSKNPPIQIRRFTITDTDSASVFTLRPAFPAMEARKYQGGCEFSAGIGRIQAINLVKMNEYLSAVVAAEGGVSANLEYYKAQAVLCRTYLILHHEKHRIDGFNLCDDVHCQAYHGINSRNPSIMKAVLASEGQVVVFQDSLLITAAYHANCGGETQNSENEWLQSLPYLRSVKDSFCMKAKSAYWEFRTERKKWINYLGKNGIKINESDSLDILNFSQKSRKSYYKIRNDSLALRKIRSDWNLKSSFFSVISDSSSTIIFKGKGYGHGIGMCQVGAMVMAQKGYDYKQILNFYFTNIQVRKADEISALDKKLRFNTIH